MKKEVGKFLFVITAMLCLFMLPGRSSIISRAASDQDKPGVLFEGKEFNAAIKNLANNTSSMVSADVDNNIKKIVFLKKNISAGEKAALEKQKKVSVGNDVWAYYSNGVLSVYSTADKIICNRHSRGLFCGLSGIESIDVTMLDFSMVMAGSGLFAFCTNLKEVNLSNVYAPELLDFSAAFRLCINLEKINFQGFYPGRIYDCNYMFADCRKLETVDLSSFRSHNIDQTNYMFMGCENLRNLDMSNFKTPLLCETEGMFEGCTKLEYLDMRNFDLSKVFMYNDMFSECFSLKTIFVPKSTNQVMNFPNLMVIDNDNDGKPDTAETFYKNPISDRINRLIAYEGFYSAFAPKAESTKPEIFVTEKGVTYRIKPDGTATVTKITAAGKVSINTVKHEGVTYPVVGVEANACKGNKKIKSLSIGKNVTSIGQNSFKNCKKLKKITIHANKELKIGKGAFKKLHKNAVIAVKGLKGKQKKALVKTISKQTNASVK